MTGRRLVVDRVPGPSAVPRRRDEPRAASLDPADVRTPHDDPSCRVIAVAMEKMRHRAGEQVITVDDVRVAQERLQERLVVAR